jgi:hypothetical protein
MLGAAADLLSTGHPAVSVGRSYYAVFHAARAVLLVLEIHRKSHHAHWAAFGQHVTAAGLLPVRLHQVGLELFLARRESDYFAEPTDTPEDAQAALEEAREFVSACRSFVESR